jgi:lycopene elongase/hydratase (dihydrobisanhydrobacterioruberin-forming)
MVLSLALMAVLETAGQRWLLAAFLFLAVAYSAPPLRFKARPFLDSASNVLYAVPAFLGYVQAANAPVPPVVLAVGFLWTAAMHLFSAVPDIRSDREAGLKTTATTLGRRGALAACLLMWGACFAVVAGSGVLWPWSLLSIVYPAIAALVLIAPATVNRVYWSFPYINGVAGMILFFLLARA